MNLTELSADSARPDETQSQRLHRLAMQDAQQQIAARYGEQCRLNYALRNHWEHGAGNAPPVSAHDRQPSIRICRESL